MSYKVKLEKATIYVEVENSIVTKASQCDWMVGKPWMQCQEKLLKKRATITRIPTENNKKTLWKD